MNKPNSNNNILFFPSHEPSQYKAIADVVKEKSPHSSLQFFLLDEPNSELDYSYVTYENLVDSCNLDIHEIDAMDIQFGCNLNNDITKLI